MKKRLIFVFLAMSLFSSCSCDKEVKKEAPKYIITDYYFEKVDDAYHVNAVVINTSSTDIHMLGYLYDVYAKDGSSKEMHIDEDGTIKGNQKRLLKFVSSELGNDVEKIHFYLADKDYGFLTYDDKDSSYYKELFTTEDFEVNENKVAVNIQNIDNVKVSLLEMIAYADNHKPVCVSYVEKPKLSDKEASSITFECDNLTEEVKEVKLNYH